VDGPEAAARVTVTDWPALGLAGDWLNVKSVKVVELLLVGAAVEAVLFKYNEPFNVTLAGP
jgi:hypothetical protein